MSEYKKLKQRLSDEKLRQEAPDWMHTTGYQILRQKHYIDDDETPTSRLKFIADYLSDYIPEELRAKAKTKFRHLLLSGKYSLSTPAFSNIGKPYKGMPISCSGGYVDDSIHSFYTSNTEIAMLSKNGFGTSAYLGDIRPRGSKISGGGESSGIVPVMDTFFDTSSKVSQGGVRRGAVACYFPIDHPDAKEVFHYVEKNQKGSNIGVNITDNFIKRYNSADPEAKELFQDLCFSRCIGKGYMHFIDRANKTLHPAFKRKGMTIKGSNLCLSADTEIMVYGELCGLKTVTMKEFDHLYHSFDHMERFVVWSFNLDDNLGEWKRVEASAMTNPNAKIMKITDEETGKFIKCTPEHKVYTKNRGYVQAMNLVESDELVIENKNVDDGTKIEYLEEYDEVYDITVADNHNFFANGVLVHNCSEIELPSDNEYSFTCCLSSLNLLHWDNITEEDIMYSLLMLDCINTDFIKHCPDELHKVKKFAEDFRAIGLGVMGLGTYFQNSGIVFDSLTAKFKNQEIFRKLSIVAKEANLWMGDLLGVPPALQEEGIRNVTQFAIAPTLSTAVVMGGVSQGQEPIFANTYIHESPAGDIRRASPWLVDLLKSKGKWDKEVLDSIVDTEGSLAHLDFLTDEEKALGKTAYEQDQYAIIRMAEDRARYIDQGQSVNLYFNALAAEKEIGDIHRYAMTECNDLKALYYIRSMSLENSKIKHEPDCASCAS